MAIDQILDHKARAKARLPGFMQGATNIELLLDALMDESQTLETVFFQLLDERHISVAVGVQLDGIGQIVDLDRLSGESDTDYRARLSDRVSEISAGGEIDSLLTAFVDQFSVAAPDDLYLNEAFPGTVIMTWLTDDDDIRDSDEDERQAAVIDSLRAAGVRLHLIRNTLANNFEFSDESEVSAGNGPIDANHGFGDEALTGGGKLGRIIAARVRVYGYSTGHTGPSIIISKYLFDSGSDSTSVGNLTVARGGVAGHQSKISGYTSGGNDAAGNVIDKFPFATDANATDVGDLTVGRDGVAGQSSANNGYTSGGDDGAASDVVDKFPFATDSNATDVGNLTVARSGVSGQSSLINGYASGGFTGAVSNIIDKFSFASDSNATDVGDLTVSRQQSSGQSSSDNGYTSGGTTGALSNVIDKFPFATDSNATDVGDLTATKTETAGASSSTHGHTMGGFTGVLTNVIERFPFATDANATDVADLYTNQREAAGHHF